jgi:hypothetical protein
MGTNNLPDFRDLVITQLTDDEVLLKERIASLESDLGVYRELTCAAFDALRDLTVRYKRLQESSNQLRDEYAAFRERILLQDGADDVAA